MLISPFTPLFFISSSVDGIPGDYIQTFAEDDVILIEVLSSPEENISITVLEAESCEDLFTAPCETWLVNDSLQLVYCNLQLLGGYYRIKINNKISEPIHITNNIRILADTTLIRYSMNSNRHRRDAVFFIDGCQQFFSFRVHGGFKDSGWSFGVDCEQFTTDESEIIHLYGIESTQKKFTMGLSQGCPIWFGELLNRILCCSHVYIGEERYVRKESSVPEVTVPQEGVNAFVFSQSLQKVTNLNPEEESISQLSLRRVDETTFRAVTSSFNRLIQ